MSDGHNISNWSWRCNHRWFKSYLKRYFSDNFSIWVVHVDVDMSDRHCVMPHCFFAAHVMSAAHLCRVWLQMHNKVFFVFSLLVFHATALPPQLFSSPSLCAWASVNDLLLRFLSALLKQIIWEGKQSCWEQKTEGDICNLTKQMKSPRQIHTHTNRRV